MPSRNTRPMKISGDRKLISRLRYVCAREVFAPMRHLRPRQRGAPVWPSASRSQGERPCICAWREWGQ